LNAPGATDLPTAGWLHEHRHRRCELAAAGLQPALSRRIRAGSGRPLTIVKQVQAELAQNPPRHLAGHERRHGIRLNRPRTDFEIDAMRQAVSAWTIRWVRERRAIVDHDRDAKHGGANALQDLFPARVMNEGPALPFNADRIVLAQSIAADADSIVANSRGFAHAGVNAWLVDQLGFNRDVLGPPATGPKGCSNICERPRTTMSAFKTRCLRSDCPPRNDPSRRRRRRRFGERLRPVFPNALPAVFALANATDCEFQRRTRSERDRISASVRSREIRQCEADPAAIRRSPLTAIEQRSPSLRRQLRGSNAARHPAPCRAHSNAIGLA